MILNHHKIDLVNVEKNECLAKVVHISGGNKHPANCYSDENRQGFNTDQQVSLRVQQHLYISSTEKLLWTVLLKIFRNLIPTDNGVKWNL